MIVALAVAAAVAFLIMLIAKCGVGPARSKEVMAWVAHAFVRGHTHDTVDRHFAEVSQQLRRSNYVEATTSSPGHLAALDTARKRFGRLMPYLGRLRKIGNDPERLLSPADRWGWLSHRKVAARDFDSLRVLLTELKRDREAEFVSCG